MFTDDEILYWLKMNTWSDEDILHFSELFELFEILDPYQGRHRES